MLTYADVCLGANVQDITHLCGLQGMRSIRMRMLTYADVCLGADSFIYYSTPSVKGSPTMLTYADVC